MKSIKNFLLLLLALPIHLFAQDLDCRFFEWTKGWGPFNNFGVYLGGNDAIITDSNGNSYIAGQFNGNMDLGNTSLSTSGGFGVFIVKMDSSGQTIWAKKVDAVNPGAFMSGVTDIRLDQHGYIYLSGFFSGTIHFDNFVLSTPYTGPGSKFIAKLNPQGSFIYAKEIGATGSFDLDSIGNIYMISTFEGSVIWSSNAFSSFGGKDILVTKMDNQGQFIWAKQYGGIGYDLGRGIAVDGDGNSYITGTFSNTIGFDNITLTTSQYAFYIVKLNTNGQVVWATAPINTTNSSRGITIDSLGNSYIIGSFNGLLQFNGQSISSTDFNTFVAKINPQGEFIDAFQFIDKNYFPDDDDFFNLSGQQISISHDFESVYINSMLRDSLMVNGVVHEIFTDGIFHPYYAELNTKGLELKWILAPKGASNIISGRISSDAQGNCYSIGGMALQSGFFGNDTIPGGGNSNATCFFTKIAGLNNLVVNTNDTLTAIQTNVNYQWLDCANNMSPIPGATSRSFYPGTVGQYAVALSNDFCTDTSACLQTTAIRQLSPLEKITVYPNPASSEITLDKLPKGSGITLYDLSGRKLRSVSNKEESSVHLSVQDLAEGLYFVEIVQQGNRVFKKVAVMKRE